MYGGVKEKEEYGLKYHFSSQSSYLQLQRWEGGECIVWLVQSIMNRGCVLMWADKHHVIIVSSHLFKSTRFVSLSPFLPSHCHMKLGFQFHHTYPDHLMMTKWLPESEPNNLPEFANHYIGQLV